MFMIETVLRHVRSLQGSGFHPSTAAACLVRPWQRRELHGPGVFSADAVPAVAEEPPSGIVDTELKVEAEQSYLAVRVIL